MHPVILIIVLIFLAVLIGFSKWCSEYLTEWVECPRCGLKGKLRYDVLHAINGNIRNERCRRCNAVFDGGSLNNGSISKWKRLGIFIGGLLWEGISSPLEWIITVFNKK